MKITFLAVLPLAVASATVLVAEKPSVVGADYSYSVKSSSMEPSIMKGDMVLASEVPPGSIEVGDVIVYRYEPADGSPLNSHRVVEIRESSEGLEFRTKGDSLSRRDGWKSREVVVGRVTRTLRNGGDLRNAVYSLPGFVFLVLIPSLTVVLDRIRVILRYRSTV